MLNISDALQRSANLYADKPALISGDARVSFSELEKTSLSIAGSLKNMGIGPGDSVALSCPNIPQFAMIYYGILSAGASVVPLNVLLRAGEIAYHLDDCKAKAFFCFQGLPDLPMGEAGLEAFNTTGSCKDFITITLDPSATEWQGEKTLNTLLSAPPLENSLSCNPDATAVILYTSGTTGYPKGAELSHSTIASNSLATQSFLKEDSRDIQLITLPLFHVFGQIVQLHVAISSGATSVLIPRFEPVAVLQALAKEKVTIFAGVPTMYIGINNAAAEYLELTQKIHDNMRVCISGGSALPVEVLRQFEERFDVPVLEGYGLSETSAAVTFNSLDHERIPGSVGKAIAGMLVRVVDEAGKILPAGEDGEVIIKGYGLMKGYYNRPEQTAEAVRNDWFHTGDIGRMDEDQNLYIVDRLKDMILRGGYNVYPRELEEKLLAHPAVSMAAVIGVPHDVFGEEIMACLVLKPGQSATEQALLEWAKDQLGGHKYPRIVELFSELPLTATGKILKRELKEQLLNRE